MTEEVPLGYDRERMMNEIQDELSVRGRPLSLAKFIVAGSENTAQELCDSFLLKFDAQVQAESDRRFGSIGRTSPSIQTPMSTNSFDDLCKDCMCSDLTPREKDRRIQELMKIIKTGRIRFKVR